MFKLKLNSTPLIAFTVKNYYNQERKSVTIDKLVMGDLGFLVVKNVA